MKTVSALLSRLHAPVSLRALDVLTGALGVSLLAIGGATLAQREYVASGAILAGGAYFVTDAHRSRAARRTVIWDRAAASVDPVTTLALGEFLMALPLADLDALSRWRPGDPVPDAMRAARAVLDATG